VSQVRKHHERLFDRTRKGKDYLGATPHTNWIGPAEFGVADMDRYFTEFDGSRSSVAHRLDRFGGPLMRWLRRQGLTRARGQRRARSSIGCRSRWLMGKVELPVDDTP
jgi:hypothetical protein